MDQIRTLHARHGVGDVGLEDASAPEIPDGWRIVVRCWDRGGFLRRGAWDALIMAPAPWAGWRLADPFAPNRKTAVRRAAAEISNFLAARS